MAIDFNQIGASATKYAYFTVGDSTTGNPIVDGGFGSAPTISWFCWFNCDDPPGALGECLAAVVNMPTGFGGSQKLLLGVTTGQYVWALAGDTGSASEAFSSTTFSLSTWNSGGAVIQSGSVTAYLNGVPGTTSTTSWSLRRALEETIIGAFPTSTVGTFNKPFKGCLAYVTAWNIALSDDQMALLATGVDPTGVAPDNIILHSPFTDEATADNCFLLPASGLLPLEETTLNYKIYNSDPMNPDASVETCLSSPTVEPPEVDDTCVPAVTFSLFKDTDFIDWASEAEDPQCGEPRDPAGFESYFTTYYHLVDDQMLWMQSPYVYTFLEEGSRNNSGPSLFMTGLWDWSEDSDASHKRTREIQVYSPRSSQSVSDTKNRVRGSGRALQLRFTSDPGKDFNILSWGVWFDRNSGY